MIPLEPTDIATDPESQLQGRVLEFLENSSFGPAKGGKRIDTHASVVFLGEDRVLKVKRAGIAAAEIALQICTRAK